MKRFEFICLLVLMAFGLSAQNGNLYTLKGNVKDHTGEGVIGANIKIKSAETGTITDIDGNFSMLVARRECELIVSYIGYTTKTVRLKEGQNDLKIILEEDAQNLDEVVVVGYGTQKRASLTSSVEVIRSEDLQRIPSMNLDEALNGQVAGLQVMSSTGDPSSAKEADIRIRGISGSPLLVIDGVPRFGENSSDGEMRLSDLNPDDIESISILKDAAASAVYGARAANGVILVKTKRGSGDKKVRVNYRGQFNLQQATKLPDFLNAYEYATLYNQVIEEDQFSPEAIEQIRTGSNPNVYGNENILDYLNKWGHTMGHSLSVAGGSEKVQYYLGGGYTTSEGLYSGVGRDRYNYSMKLDATLVKGLTLSVDLTGNRSVNKNTSYTTIDAAYSYAPTQPLRFTDGSLASIDSGNPLIAIDGLGGYIQDKVRMNTLSATLRYELPWVKGLSVYARGTVDDNHSTKKTFNKPTTLYIYDEITGQISEDAKTIYPNAKVSLTERDQSLDNKLVEAGVNYARTFAEKHDVGAMIVFNYQESASRYMSGTNQDMVIFPEILGTATSSALTGNESYTQRASVVGRATYGYDSRYFVEGNFRMDGSTKFTPENRWQFFPSVSGSWVVSNESFFRNWNQKTLSNVKMRGSVGILGSDGSLSDYGYLMNYISTLNSGYPIGDSMKPGLALGIDGYPNPDLKMEISKDYNVGLDLGFWNNRFAVSYEYYWRYRSNMLTLAPTYLYPPSTGVSGNVPYMNFGELKAWGWDLTVVHKNTVGKWKYDAQLTLTKTNDKYLDYGDESSVDPNLRRKGRPSMTWTVYEADGLFQSWEEIENHTIDQDGSGNATLAPGDIKYKDQNADGRISSSDKILVKNSSYPDMSVNLNLNVSYKGFFAGAMFQGVTGYQQKINEQYTLKNGTLQKFQRYHLTDTWREDNTNASYPRLKLASKNDNNRLESTFWIRDCNFLRLKSLSLGYNVPAHLIKRAHISTLSIALRGGNLFTLSSLKEMDPESLRGYPVQRTYGVSINFGF